MAFPHLIIKSNIYILYIQYVISIYILVFSHLFLNKISIYSHKVKFKKLVGWGGINEIYGK